MAVLNQTDIVGPQHEVQRLLGRCLLRVQQYERLLKAMIAVQKLSGTPETLPHALDARKAEASDKTLGTLVGRLMGDYIMKEGVELQDDDVPPILSSTAIWSPIPNDKEIGREEAFYRRADHRLPA